jgi:hypothetical protein
LTSVFQNWFPLRTCRQGIDGHRGKEFLDEGFAPRPPFGRISTVDTVNEFDDTNGR